MGFLAPSLLALAAFVGVPLLVHLLRRRVGRTVDFPAVRYLTRMEQEHSRERKLRHRLLLFLRLLAVVALAVAAARPIARLAGLGHAPVSLAVVVDNSMSAGVVREGRSTMDAMRADAQRLLGELTPDDRAWLVTADGRVIGGNSAALETALAALKPLGGRGDLSGAVRRAVTLVRSGAPRAPVVTVITDGQASAWSPLQGDTVATVVNADAVPIQLLTRAPAATRNAAVVEVRTEPARWTPAGTVAFAVHGIDSLDWRVTLDGRTVARGRAPAATADAPTPVTQRLASAANGWVRGSVELDADELRGDDARWFAVRVAPPSSVVIRSEAGAFLTAALTTLVEEKRLERGTAGARGVVTVSGADAPLNAGPVLLTAPADPLRVGEANRTLARLGIPWRYGAIARDLVIARGAAALEGVQVRVRYPLQYSPGSATNTATNNATSATNGSTASTTGERTTDTIATAGGTPWAVAGNGYVLLGSPIDPDATDLPLRAGFVPWVLESLARRLGEDGIIVHATPGQGINDRAIGSASALEAPDGSLIPLAGDRVTVPNESGVYFLRRQSARIGAIVVNAEASESDLRGESTRGAAFRARVSGRAVSVDTVADVWRRHVLAQAAGRSLLSPLLVVALLALLLEAWFSRTPRTVTSRTS
ncbi:MAG: BatA domain-containing protein [Gemmatimonadaceae bacterium]|nr:BatA domain-containing protein [Gemmatimonadaceae bacterium]